MQTFSENDIVYVIINEPENQRICQATVLKTQGVVSKEALLQKVTIGFSGELKTFLDGDYEIDVEKSKLFTKTFLDAWNNCSFDKNIIFHDIAGSETFLKKALR